MKLGLPVALLCVAVGVSGGVFESQFNHAMRSASAKLYRAIANEGGNAVISPFSITQALGMTLAGAENNTKDQILRWLSLDRIQVEGDMINKINWQMKHALSKFANTNEENDPGISVANAMWVQNDYDVNQRYRNTLVDRYQTEAFSLDFANSQASADRINNWVGEKTNDKIEDLVQPRMLGGLTRMVLTNAMYFGAKWVEAFQDDGHNYFYLRNGQRVPVTYMRKLANMYTKIDSNFRFVAIPYENPSGAQPVSFMVIAVPRSYRDSLQQNSIADSLESINLGTKQGWSYHPLRLFMPKFEISHESNIKQILARQGVRDLFSPEICDLTGINNSGELYVSDYVHKSYIKVNEEGTEAAAASSVIFFGRSALGPRSLFVDRPFFFGIYNSDVDSFLFVGKVENPNE